MYDECKKLVETQLVPQNLDVLEVSGRFWRDVVVPGFKSYTSFANYDVCAGKFPGRTFDLIILDQVLEHVRHPQRALENVRSSLNPGGACLVTTPFLIRVHRAPDDYWRWTEDGLRCLLEDAGFGKISTGSWGNRECLTANLVWWVDYVPHVHSLVNEPDFPVTVWALAIS